MTEPKEKELKIYSECEIADEHSKVCHCQTESKDKQIVALRLQIEELKFGLDQTKCVVTQMVENGVLQDSLTEMNQDKYSPIPGVMDTIDCLRKERDELKKSLKTLVYAVDWAMEEKHLSHPKVEAAVMENLELKFQAARNRAIKWRTLWGELVEPVGKYSDMPIIIDQEIEEEVISLKQQASSDKRIKEKK